MPSASGHSDRARQHPLVFHPPADPKRKLTITRVIVATPLLALLACSTLTGCRPDSGPSDFERIYYRWIDSGQTDALDKSQLYGSERVFRLEFSDPKVASSWTDSGLGERTNDGLSLTGEEKHLEGVVHLRAIDVRSISVTGRLSRPGALECELQWAAPGEQFSRQRSVRVQVTRENIALREEIPVGDHAAWTGDIERLRLSMRFPGDVVVQRLTGRSARLDPERLPAILAKPWKVDVGSELRNAIVTAPGLEMVRAVRIPKSGRLQFGYSHLFRSKSAVHYEIALVHDGERSILFQASLEQEQMPLRRWLPGSVDLEPWAGQEVELAFRTSMDAADTELYGLPLWSTPEMLGETDEPKINVILISIDTLRADRMSLYGHQRPTTPHLQEWADRSGVVFTNAIAQAPWTLPSHTTMLTGLSTFRHGVNHASTVPDTLRLLPEYLRDEGYRTLAITGGGFLDPGYHLTQGFDQYRYWTGSDLDTGRRISNDREIEEHIDLAIEWVRENRFQPFFLFFHTYDIHHRVSPREPYFSEFSELEAPPNLRLARTRWLPGFKKARFYVLREEDGQVSLPENLAALPGDIYDSRIANMDQLIGGLLHYLDEIDLSARTIVIFTSDHGELLGEHGIYDHLSLFEENLRVPLVIAAPGVQRTEPTVTAQVRTMDITPTVLDLLGIGDNEDLEGESLKRLMEEGREETQRPAWSYAARSNYGMAVRLANRVKLIFNNTAWSPIHGDTQLYRLDEDPAESRPVSDRETQARLLGPLKEKYLGEVRGLRMEFTNPTGKSFQISIEGSVSRTFITTKTVDMPACECAKWEDQSILVHMPPETHFSLIFENENFQDSSFVLTGAGFEATVRPRDDLTDGDHLLQWKKGAWADTSGPVDESAPRIRILWQGPMEAQSSAPEETDTVLRERLRALGYL